MAKKGQLAPTLQWVRDALRLRGYSQKDLARAWATSEPSISRFISGEEQQDPSLSRALSLARMLGISIEELAKGLGVNGKVIEPTVNPTLPGLPPVGTFSMSMIEPGKVRVVMVQDLPPAVAGQVVTVLGGAPAGGAIN